MSTSPKPAAPLPVSWDGVNDEDSLLDHPNSGRATGVTLGAVLLLWSALAVYGLIHLLTLTYHYLLLVHTGS